MQIIITYSYQLLMIISHIILYCTNYYSLNNPVTHLKIKYTIIKIVKLFKISPRNHRYIEIRSESSLLYPGQKWDNKRVIKSLNNSIIVSET